MENMGYGDYDHFVLELRQANFQLLFFFFQT